MGTETNCLTYVFCIVKLLNLFFVLETVKGFTETSLHKTMLITNYCELGFQILGQVSYFDLYYESWIIFFKSKRSFTLTILLSLLNKKNKIANLALEINIGSFLIVINWVACLLLVDCIVCSWIISLGCLESMRIRYNIQKCFLRASSFWEKCFYACQNQGCVLFNLYHLFFSAI